MIITLAVILLINAAFAAVVWPTFYKRVAKDARARNALGRPTAFLTVHRVIVSVALVIAAVSLVAALIALFTR